MLSNRSRLVVEPEWTCDSTTAVVLPNTTTRMTGQEWRGRRTRVVVSSNRGGRVVEPDRSGSRTRPLRQSNTRGMFAPQPARNTRICRNLRDFYHSTEERGYQTAVERRREGRGLRGPHQGQQLCVDHSAAKPQPNSPSLPSDGGEGRGEEARGPWNYPSPRSSPHSFVVGRGRRTHARQNRRGPRRFARIVIHAFPETSLGTRGFAACPQAAAFPHRGIPMILSSMILSSSSPRTCLPG